MLLECYKITSQLPVEERYNLISQVRRAEIDSALETIIDLKYVSLEAMQNVGILLNRCFSMLTKMTAS
jgi:hypothetical protein